MNYDESILEKHADKLIVSAKNIEAGYAFVGVVLGTLSAFGAFAYNQNTNGIAISVIAAFIVISMFVLIGRSKAMALRVQANMAYALIQIERNTRKNEP